MTRMFVRVRWAAVLALVFLLAGCRGGCLPGQQEVPPPDAGTPPSGGDVSNPPADDTGTQQPPGDAGSAQQGDTQPPEPTAAAFGVDLVQEGCVAKNIGPRDPVVARGCPNSRWVGTTSQATCPPPPAGWRGGALFSADGGLVPDPRFGRFCYFEALAPELVDDAALCRLPDDEGKNAGQWLERDCLSANIAAGLDPALKDFAAWRYELFQRHMEFPKASMLPIPTHTEWPSHERNEATVHILDSAGATLPAAIPDSWHHGLLMHAIARSVVCGRHATGCLAAVQRKQALKGDRVPGAPPRAVGFQGMDIAREIYASVTGWEADHPDVEGHRMPGLVINLSLGWEAIYNQGTDLPGVADAERAGSRAVQSALEVAACRDVLVVAAAGNPSTGRSPSQGPLYPAAWQSTRGPGIERCACLVSCGTLQACEACPADRDEKSPLLYAAGAVDEADGELIGAREKAIPDRVAPSIEVTAPLPDDNDLSFDAADRLLLPPMTGTSIGTAAVSGLAAAIWRLKPQLARERVMSIIDNNGVELGFPATFCSNGGTCGNARRVSLCRALIAAGEFTPSTGPASAQPGSLSQLTNDLITDCGARAVAAGELGGQGAVPAATVDAALAMTGTVSATWSAASDAPITTDPNDEHPDAFSAPWAVNTQPPSDPCPVCLLRARLPGGMMVADITMRIASSSTPLELHDTTLELVYTDGTRAYHAIQSQLGAPFLSPSRTYSLTGMPLRNSALRGALVSWRVPQRSGSDISMHSVLTVTQP